jgi:hypothetical protein
MYIIIYFHSLDIIKRYEKVKNLSNVKDKK